MSTENKLGFIDIAESNQEIETELENLIKHSELIDESSLLIEVESMLKNMMNFFALQINEIPSFDNLTPQQKKILAAKIKFLGKEIKQKKIATSKEVAHSLIFTILNLLGERGKILEAEEILNYKSREGLRNFLRNAASHEIYKINHQEETIDTNISKDFIHDAVLLGVTKAMQNIGIKVDQLTLNKSPLRILEEAHKKLQQKRQL